MEEFIITIFGIGIFTIIVIMITISRLLLICHPNEVIILSGRKRRLPDGSVVGYRMIRGGRAIRVPLIERAARMSLETIPLDLSVYNAYSKGGIPLKVEAIANIKVDSNEPVFGNAVERFLGKRREEIHEIAKDTLEGNLRGVLATLTPEEVNEDRLKFASSLIEEADSDLAALGLQLDTLKIQNVSDDAGYLDSIGRRKTAEVLSQARTAEASRKSEAEQAEATAERQAEIAKAEAKMDVESARIESERSILVNKARAQQDIETENNLLRIKKAELEREAIIKEMEAETAGEKARVIFEQDVEQQRIILQQKRLIADVIEPARANKEAMELQAKGEAASILENGMANLDVLNKMIETYKSAEGEGEKIFILNMLPEIIEQLVSTVGNMKIDKISVVDSGGGRSVSNVIGQLPNAVISLNEIIENATGVNILNSLQRDTLTQATKSLEESAHS